MHCVLLTFPLTSKMPSINDWEDVMELFPSIISWSFMISIELAVGQASWLIGLRIIRRNITTYVIKWCHLGFNGCESGVTSSNNPRIFNTPSRDRGLTGGKPGPWPLALHGCPRGRTSTISPRHEVPQGIWALTCCLLVLLFSLPAPLPK